MLKREIHQVTALLKREILQVTALMKQKTCWRGSSRPHYGAERCACCNDGFALNGITCKANECNCNGGAAKTGLDCATHGAERFACCNGGFAVNGMTCKANVCNCNGGTANTGSDCTTHGGEMCAGCDGGFALNGITSHTAKLNDLLDGLELNQVVIFVMSMQRAVDLDKLLVECILPSNAAHSGLNQVQEERIARYKQFTDLQKRIRVTMDRFGRGIDIELVTPSSTMTGRRRANPTCTAWAAPGVSV